MDPPKHLSYPHHHHHHHYHHCHPHIHHHHYHHRNNHHHHHHHHHNSNNHHHHRHPHPQHHHHHHHILPQGALHNQFLQQTKLNLCPNLTNPPPQIPQSTVAAPFQYEADHLSNPNQALYDDGCEEFVEDEDEEPFFVMTDEWREFFAKSEAKRREAKKLAKKQGKK